MLRHDWDRVSDSQRLPRHSQWFEGQWLAYTERGASRRRYAQPDLYIRCPSFIICFEFKLTRCRDALAQLERLYMPLLALRYSAPVLGVAAFYNSGGAFEPPSAGPNTLRDVLQMEPGTISEWHYLA